jgi:hypothetical protein
MNLVAATRRHHPRCVGGVLQSGASWTGCRARALHATRLIGKKPLAIRNVDRFIVIPLDPGNIPTDLKRPPASGG